MLAGIAYPGGIGRGKIVTMVGAPVASRIRSQLSAVFTRPVPASVIDCHDKSAVALVTAAARNVIQLVVRQFVRFVQLVKVRAPVPR